MPHLLIFGLGYTATRLARRLTGEGWTVAATGQRGTLDFANATRVDAAIRRATHILSSVPPADEGDPVLLRYGAALQAAPARWIGYLSSTGVYGDTGGAWVDESAPIGTGRRSARSAADQAWQAIGPPVHSFRLPGIYGPGRSALDRIRAGRARRIDAAGQVFSRIHVDDIVSGLMAGMAGPPGIYNLADDLPAPQHEVIAHGCALLGLPAPSLLPLDDAGLSPAARGFYAENRRVSAGKARRLLGWRPQWPDYRAGLAACHAAQTCPHRDDHAA